MPEKGTPQDQYLTDVPSSTLKTEPSNKAPSSTNPAATQASTEKEAIADPQLVVQNSSEAVTSLASTTNPTVEHGIGTDGSSTPQYADPLSLGQHKRSNVSQKQLAAEHPRANKRKLKKFYTRQNEMIDQFLQSGDEERLAALDMEVNGPRIQFAIYGSSGVNLCLFIIQLYAAITTGSLSLFATAADAFMDLVSSCVMMMTAYLAKRPSIYKYPVGRTRIETIGIILFCALMTTVAVQLIVSPTQTDAAHRYIYANAEPRKIESGRALNDHSRSDEPLKIVPLICVAVAIFSKFSLMVYCFFLRRYPVCRVFFIDHRNDIVVNTFGLIMSIVGTRLVWWLDPFGAICIGLLILFSWATTAFEHVWLLVGKGAPKEFISKVIYLTMVHDDQIRKVDTCRAYHAGEKFYVEVDIIMDETAPLKTTHDVSQTLQRKIEGLEDVERAFVHVDYEHDHDVHEEHKPLYAPKQPRRSFGQFMKESGKRVAQLISPNRNKSPRGDV